MRIAGGRRVGRVGLDQHRRALAALQAAREVRRDRARTNCTSPCASSRSASASLDGMRDHAEIAGVLQRAHERARVDARLGRDARAVGRRLRVGVDGVAEQHQLHHRHADHHREGEPVAAQLHEFLREHGEEAVQGEHGAQWPRRRVASSRPPMRWMKTSSRPGATSRSSMPGRAAIGRQRRARAPPRSRAAHVQRVAERRHHLDPGQRAQLRDQRPSALRPRAPRWRGPRRATTSARLPCASSLP